MDCQYCDWKAIFLFLTNESIVYMVWWILSLEKYDQITPSQGYNPTSTCHYQNSILLSNRISIISPTITRTEQFNKPLFKHIDHTHCPKQSSIKQWTIHRPFIPNTAQKSRHEHNPMSPSHPRQAFTAHLDPFGTSMPAIDHTRVLFIGSLFPHLLHCVIHIPISIKR
jgi:hypothetical protein